MTARWGDVTGAGGIVRIPEDSAPVLHDLSVPVHGHAFIYGVVQESSTELPVVDARVRLEVDDEPSVEAVTDAYGRFALDSVPAGEHRLSVSHPAYYGGGARLAARPGERVEVAVRLPVVSNELRRLLPTLASRASTVTIDVVTRAMPSDGAEGSRRQR